MQHLHMIIMDWNGFDDGGVGQNECVGDIENELVMLRLRKKRTRRRW